MNEPLEKLKFLIENLPNINENMNFLITELEETQKAFDELDSSYIDLQEQNKRYREALEEIMKIQENHEWNLYGIAYGIAERTLFEVEGEE